MLLKQRAKAIHKNFKVGFADHPREDKFASTFCLVAIGADRMVIEKHLTLGKSYGNGRF